ncbi:dihydroxyacetone kinase subunit L [Salmonella enterica subsp. enterica serovar Java]|uniref:Dihydroxyacetone kinase subunit L n=2 Tax=Salmonella enterica TaxID=28901 RepID=A0A3Z6QRU6_SALEB|nr:dihydroxyacetone kinase subunit DhaL [Salmonella enterica]EAB6033051.1 dihydroxyacetone kinase subunit L [Salmonella enterica subsp. enterica serovar Java]EBV8392165.1 dihydroxyacetone kinase subunit L [Salmonella enterica subsp. enterica serovar Virchow]ECA0404165.1 dihydroxyacetone kinase subunit L [Salmonella enterica subsp. enterica serovar Newport]ECC9065768.1 dihydroxyacetone kinase subunit L [Salmonella enterica subsp. diarizonae]ECM6138222.1 dihydroxyacetone kinase subunit L [Salmon
MSEFVSTQSGNRIVSDLVHIIISHRDYLSEIDGAIGDGDHGINMSKGFALCGDKIRDKSLTMSEGFDVLSDTLMEDIGGSMGPLYGSLFLGMANSIRNKSELNPQDFLDMLNSALNELRDISDAQPGDKCIMDALCPAISAFGSAVGRGESFYSALEKLKLATAEGRDSTRDMVAKIGRASRLGERSRGVLDAGAVSCCLLLTQLAESVQLQLTAIEA